MKRYIVTALKAKKLTGRLRPVVCSDSDPLDRCPCNGLPNPTAPVPEFDAVQAVIDTVPATVVAGATFTVAGHYERTPPLGSWYIPADFIYVRQVNKDKGALYLVDQANPSIGNTFTQPGGSSSPLWALTDAVLTRAGRYQLIAIFTPTAPAPLHYNDTAIQSRVSYSPLIEVTPAAANKIVVEPEFNKLWNTDGVVGREMEIPITITDVYGNKTNSNVPITLTTSLALSVTTGNTVGGVLRLRTKIMARGYDDIVISSPGLVGVTLFGIGSSAQQIMRVPPDATVGVPLQATGSQVG